MNTNHALQTDVLDILFANRNKSYGAYQLRKSYKNRLLISVLVMMGACLIFSAIFKWNALHSSVATSLIVSDDIHLVNAKTTEPPMIQPPPVKLQRTEKPQIATQKFATPKLVNENVLPPPTQDDLSNIKIDVATREGIHTDIVAPPVEQSTGSEKSPVTKQGYELGFTPIQQQARFPGGLESWRKFLEKNLRSTTPAENGAAVGTYTVVVSFLVDKTGAISEVKADNDPGYGTAAEAVRVIQRGPAWTPAVQNGRNVIYRQKQAITFVVSNEE